MAYFRFFALAVLGLFAPLMPVFTFIHSALSHLGEYGESAANVFGSIHNEIQKH